MSNFAPYSNYGYFVMSPEAVEGTPVVPSNFLRIVNESLLPSFNISPVQEVSGDRERNIRSIKDQIEMSGDVVFNVETKMIGHFLRGVFGIPTTQTLTAGVAYRHVFEVTDTPKTYTIDAKVADAPWVHRFWGVKINQTAYEVVDNKIQCTASLMPRKAFITSAITVAVNSGTTLTLDQTSGLTTSDTILVLDKADGFTTLKELTITSIDSETQLTTATIDVQLDVGDLVVIKKATASYNQDPVVTWLGGSEISIGDDIDNLTAEDKENFNLTYVNEVEAKYLGGKEEISRFPGEILTKGYSGSGNLSRFYDSELNLARLRQNVKSALRVCMQGETALEANVLTKASSTFGATANGFKVEASTGGQAGNQLNVTIVVADDDNLAVTKVGNNILIELANTTAANNTGTLIAAAIDLLSGVDGTAEGTGAEEFTTAADNANIGFVGNTDVVGRDADEKPYILFDNADVRTDAYFANNVEDSNVMEEIPLTFYKDVESGDQSKKWSTRVFLVNEIASYE